MAEYDALKEILGKTIKGVIVKKNEKGALPAMSVHLVFNDDTSYELYTDYHINFAGGLIRGAWIECANMEFLPRGR